MPAPEIHVLGRRLAFQFANVCHDRCRDQAAKPVHFHRRASSFRFEGKRRAQLNTPHHKDADTSVRGRSLKRRYISLTSHPGNSGVQPVGMRWGSSDPFVRGPIISSVHDGGRRNAIGCNGGAYGVYRALAIAAGALNPDTVPNFANTQPAFKIGPFPQWGAFFFAAGTQARAHTH